MNMNRNANVNINANMMVYIGAIASRYTLSGARSKSIFTPTGPRHSYDYNSGL